MRLPLVIGLALGLLQGAAAPGWAAEPSADRETRAKTLFDEGATAAERGDQRAACDKFAESLALLERASTLLNLGSCEAALGRLAASCEHLQQGIALLPPNDERLKSAQERLAAVVKRVPRITVEIPAGTPAGSKVQVDGNDVDGSKLAGLRLDPGKHTVVLVAPDRKDASVSLSLEEGQTEKVLLTLGPEAKDEPAGATRPDDNPSPTDDADGSDQALRTAGLAAGAIGIAGAVVAGITGGMLLSKQSTVEERCPNNHCDQEGWDAVEASDSLLVANYVGWGVGIAGIGAGAALLIADLVTGEAGTPVETGLAPVPGGAALTWRGRF
jgi:hypothetical protein